MRKALIVAAVTLLTGVILTTALPQTALAAKGKHATERLQKMAQTLNLTDAQKAQIKPILISTRQQVHAVKQDTSLSPEDRKAKLKTLRQAMRSQLIPILTPDQKMKLAQMRHTHKGKAANA